MNYLLNGKKKWPGTILPTALCKVLSDMGTKILTQSFTGTGFQADEITRDV